MELKLFLVIENIENLPENIPDCSLIAKVEWRGSERKVGLLAKSCKKNYTCQQKVEEDGKVSWNEGFGHDFRLNRERAERYESWIIALKIMEAQEKSSDKMRKVGRAKMDVAEFIQIENEESIKLPISCSFRGHIAEAMLTVKLQISKTESKDTILIRPASQSATNWLLKSTRLSAEGGALQKQRSLKKVLSLKTSTPEKQLCIHCLAPFKKIKVRPEEILKPLAFEIGHWQKKKLFSRDGSLELETDVFLASIDQRSKIAAGGSACTVLATVIAEWLHAHSNSLPLRYQFDQLILRGSSKWRILCQDEKHKSTFADKHFDLDTVLEASLGVSLKIDIENSFVGFFGADAVPEAREWLQGQMSFDEIWGRLVKDRIYIISWNDHFFVLKVESGVMYMIDTLGERLAEGCNQAYILKFGAESAIYRRGKDGKKRRSDSGDLLSQGMECCREYIKGFLSAVPLREFRKDVIRKGRVRHQLLCRYLQIDFYCTAKKTD